MSNENSFRLIAEHVARTLEPLRDALSDEDAFRSLMYRLGWSVRSFPPAYASLRSDIDAAIHAIAGLAADPEIDQILGALNGFRDVYQAVLSPPVPDGVDAGAFLQETGKQLFAISVADYLQRALPALSQALQATGVIAVEYRESPVGRTPFFETRLDYDKIQSFIEKPGEFVRELYQWGLGEFAFGLFFDQLLELFASLNLRASEDVPAPEIVDGYQPDSAVSARRIARRLRVALFEDDIGDVPFEAGFELLDLPADSSHPPGLIFQPFLPSSIGASFAITDNLELQIRAGSDVASTFGILVRPDANDPIEVRYPFQPSTQPPSAGFGLALEFTPDEATLLLGRRGGSRLEVNGFRAGLNLDFQGTRADATLSLAPRGLEVAVKAAEGDGFLGKLLGDVDVEAPFSLALDWSVRKGLRISGSGAFELATTPNLQLGPIELNRLSLSVKGASAGGPALVTRVGLGLKAALGPVVASVDNVGVELEFRFSEGNLGPFNLDVGFAPPTGVGIAVNSGPVSGGGFLSFEDGRYSGAVELTIYSVSVKAFGLIETKFADGTRGFSFVIVISAEFPAIQLGFGFTLLGVGGLIGINRSVNATELQRIVTEGSAGNLLFPQNVVANAPAIIRDLGAVFPAREGHYVFGPLAKLGWGTPTLVHGELGLILELPGPTLSILGEVRVLLPKPEAALVKLNLSVGGFIDFPHKTFALFASLHDSVIVGYPVSGQMAMRLVWGEQPSFVLSVGGFHPAFKPPSDFPKLQPMALDLGKKGSVSVTVSGFFAVTSNTLQIGGEVKLHAGGSGISLDALLAAKALFVFSPFSFEARVDASVKISFHGRGPSVHLSGVLSGPAPWRMRGEVCVSILWWDACLRFDQTFSEGTPEILPTIDPWEGQPASGGTPAVIGLRAALEEPGNWKTELPPGSLSVVSRAAGSENLVDPLGGLSVRERVVPLQTPAPITRFGAAKTPAPVSFALASAKLPDGSELTHFNDVEDFFPAAQYFELDDAKKLSAPGFEKFQAGYRLQANARDVRLGSSRSLEPVTYDSLIIAADGSSSDAGQYLPSEAHVDGATKKSAAALFGAHRSGMGQYVDRQQTQALEVRSATFSFADTRTLQAPAGAPAPAQRSQALLALSAHLAQKPEQHGLLQVVALHELA